MNILKGILPLTLEPLPPRCKLDNCRWAAKEDGLCINHKPKKKRLYRTKTGIKGISIYLNRYNYTKYRVDSTNNNKRQYIGLYETLEEAKRVLKLTKIEFRDAPV